MCSLDLLMSSLGFKLRSFQMLSKRALLEKIEQTVLWVPVKNETFQIGFAEFGHVHSHMLPPDNHDARPQPSVRQFVSKYSLMDATVSSGKRLQTAEIFTTNEQTEKTQSIGKPHAQLE